MRSTDPTQEIVLDHADYSGPIRQHELGHTRSGINIALRDLHHGVGIDCLPEVSSSIFLRLSPLSTQHDNLPYPPTYKHCNPGQPTVYLESLVIKSRTGYFSRDPEDGRAICSCCAATRACGRVVGTWNCSRAMPGICSSATHGSYVQVTFYSLTQGVYEVKCVFSSSEKLLRNFYRIQFADELRK